MQVMREAASEMPDAAGSCILVMMHNSNLILILYLLLPVLDTQYQYLSILVVVQISNLMMLSLPSSAQRRRTEHTWKGEKFEFKFTNILRMDSQGIEYMIYYKTEL